MSGSLGWEKASGTRVRDAKGALCQEAWVQPQSAPVGPKAVSLESVRLRDRPSGKSKTGRAMGRKRLRWKINRQQRRKAI